MKPCSFLTLIFVIELLQCETLFFFDIDLTEVVKKEGCFDIIGDVLHTGPELDGSLLLECFLVDLQLLHHDSQFELMAIGLVDIIRLSDREAFCVLEFEGSFRYVVFG